MPFKPRKTTKKAESPKAPEEPKTHEPQDLPDPPETPKAPEHVVRRGDMYRHPSANVWYLVTSVDPIEYTFAGASDAFEKQTWDALVGSSVAGGVDGLDFVVSMGAKWKV